MPAQRFLIANLTSGQVTNPDAWLIMDDAWSFLQNAHTWRGKLVKRIGAKEMDTSKAYNIRQLFTRLRINIGVTDNTGALIGAPVAVPGVVNNSTGGALFSCGTEIYTVVTPGTPATLITALPGTGVPLFYTSGGMVGQFSLTGAPPLSIVYYYPALPVMALPTYQLATLNVDQLVAFDTQFAYKYVVGSGWQILGPVPPAMGSGLWSGTDSQFHWATNWRGATGSEYYLFVVNGNAPDEIQYFDGTNWNAITPVYNTTTMDVIYTANIIIPFKGRLLLMNTQEQVMASTLTFTNRVRYSQIGDPTTATAWDEIVAGRGGFVDIPTREAITSCQYIKDRLIVFCESSTWEIVYTGNEVFPFRFQQINTELGVESIKSVVPFDKYLLGFGSTGIHSCNGMNVTRIDSQIPETIFNILNNNNGPIRTQGIRDYFSEEVYFSYVSATNGTTYPNTMLLYNYITQAWATNTESITAFGYYQPNNAVTWEQLTSSWQDGDEQWGDPSDIALYSDIVAGNQQGFTFIMTHTLSQNSQTLSITNITVTNNIVTMTVINHNLVVGTWINIENVSGLFGLNSGVINYRVNTVTDANTIGIVVAGVTGSYTGAGTIVRIDGILMQSKQYNFFNKTIKKIRVSRIDFLTDTIANGTISLDFSPSFSDQGIVTGGATTGANVGTYLIDMNPITTLEMSQEKMWRSVYPLLEGDVIQLTIGYSQTQFESFAQSTQSFRLHAMAFFAWPTYELGD